MTEKIKQKQTLQNAIGLRAWHEWLGNPEYRPIKRVPLSLLFPLPSLSSLSQAITSLAEGARRISARREKI